MTDGFLCFPPIPAEPLVRQVKRTRIKREDFHILKVIGRGNFSEVSRFGAGTTQVSRPGVSSHNLKKKDAFHQPFQTKVVDLNLARVNDLRCTMCKLATVGTIAIKHTFQSQLLLLQGLTLSNNVALVKAKSTSLHERLNAVCTLLELVFILATSCRPSATGRICGMYSVCVCVCV